MYIFMYVRTFETITCSSGNKRAIVRLTCSAILSRVLFVQDS